MSYEVKVVEKNEDTISHFVFKRIEQFIEPQTEGFSYVIEKRMNYKR